MKYKLLEIADKLGATLHGDPDVEITCFAPLHLADASAVSFAIKPASREALKQTSAAAVLIDESLLPDCPAAALVVPNVSVAQAKCAVLFVEQESRQGVHPTAVIDESVVIPDSVYVGPYCVIESGVSIGAYSVILAHTVISKNVQIGENCFIHPHVTCYPGVEIHDRVILHSGAVIGSDGFGLANDDGRWLKVAQLGSVIIADDVEVGASTTIDRGTLENTTIAKGVKIDNQVHIAHNVNIGENTAIAACVGVAGSSTIGKNCILAGMVGVGDHVNIVDAVVVAAQTGVGSDLKEPGVYSSYIPAQPAMRWQRIVARLKNLDSFYQRLLKMEKNNEPI